MSFSNSQLWVIYRSKLPNHIGQSSMTNVRVSEEHLKDKISNRKDEQSGEDTSI